VAYSTIPIQFIFDNLTALLEPSFPLEGYHSLRDAFLVSAFIGQTANLPGYVAYRAQTKQLIVAFSGTASAMQAFYDVRALKHRHRSGRGSVHSGFWKLYKGIKSFAVEGIRKGLAEHEDIAELIFTGHSMGATVSQLLLLDILRDENLVSSGAIPIKLVVFGAPRSGTKNLVKFWKELLDKRRSKYGDDSFTEYSVKTYNDGKLHLLGFSSVNLTQLFQASRLYPHAHSATAITLNLLSTLCTGDSTGFLQHLASTRYSTSPQTWRMRMSFRIIHAAATTTTTAATWRSSHGGSAGWIKP
jgi:hypothetical protein